MTREIWLAYALAATVILVIPHLSVYPNTTFTLKNTPSVGR
mgnify:CR=1 FL=1